MTNLFSCRSPCSAPAGAPARPLRGLCSQTPAEPTMAEHQDTALLHTTAQLLHINSTFVTSFWHAFDLVENQVVKQPTISVTCVYIDSICYTSKTCFYINSQLSEKQRLRMRLWLPLFLLALVVGQLEARRMSGSSSRSSRSSGSSSRSSSSWARP